MKHESFIFYLFILLNEYNKIKINGKFQLFEESKVSMHIATKLAYSTLTPNAERSDDLYFIYLNYLNNFVYLKNIIYFLQINLII